MKLRCKLFGHNHKSEDEVCDTCGMHEYFDSKYHNESNGVEDAENYDDCAILMMPIWRLRNKLTALFDYIKSVRFKDKCYHCEKESIEFRWKIKNDKCPKCNELRLPF